MEIVYLIIGLAVGFAAGLAVAAWRRAGAPERAREAARAEFEAAGQTVARDLAAAREALASAETLARQLQARLDEERGATLRARAELDGLRGEHSALQRVHAEAEARFEERRRALEEQQALLENARAQLADTFKALSSEALSAHSKSFLDLARQTFARDQTEARADLEKRQKAVEALVQPISDTLRRYETRVQEVEAARLQQQGELRQNLKALAEANQRLERETGNLVQALRAPAVRGRWGELQLRRVVELAGMQAYCDFTEQESTDTDEGRLRPDLVVKLPGGRNIVVDAKASLKAYLESLEAPDAETRRARLVEHARQLRARVAELAKKKYWEQFQPAPDFVALFVPGEMFFSAALEHDPDLLEDAARERVILATPTTLISLLRAVAYGWREVRLAENARQVSDLGRELHGRLATLGDHLEKLGRGLSGAVDAYNKTIGALESRVFVSARKFKELGAAETDHDLAVIDPVEKIPRDLQSADWEDAPGEADEPAP